MVDFYPVFSLNKTARFSFLSEDRAAIYTKIRNLKMPLNGYI